ncbi:phage antirepressor [Lactobacillus delbrueckii subsp. lactis]|jgi:anti-repressor protein|uniref:Phage antirepressor n=1 Tax=Lactobacillus delbrueckii subsp. lactis TaxID=29397 RepID=A0A3G6JDA5_LACDL|nr:MULTISPECIES: phage antirepressor [Lactobacillales]ADQ61269.1 anti-repressor-like protein [Lactobacillus delbrueckii subsp. bulgaricus ND02]AZA15949.1 MAG: phage antirepressor [Lactobacillus delbrueckii subsp. lactis]MBO3081415.1 phage antirepressor [Lactobacillus delbrueckii subsp. bulgaricus]MCD5438043.1 phage antirepressor [Lactobacillus delbrueckii subsp. lactis]MCD5468657.1 phage antirepressor [Lactobacillus delbrueckii subsp. lactis]
MENGVQTFNFESSPVRVIEIDNEPWFVGKDVAKVLGYSNPQKALRDHVDEEDSRGERIVTPSGIQTTKVINESGLYSLILSSKLPTAKKFKRWVTSVVLPSIRKHGMFATEKTIDQMLEDPDSMIRVLTEMKEERAKRRLAEEKAAKLEPKAKFCDVVLQNPALVNVTVIAKDYGMSAQAMNKLLENLGVQYNQNKVWFLYAKYQSNGWTQSTTSMVKGKDGAEKAVVHTKWTQKGRLGLYELLKDHGLLPVIEREEQQ